MKSHLKKSLDFFGLYERFLSDNKKGRRIQPNGKRVSCGTIRNYYYAYLLLKRFSDEKKFMLRIRPAHCLNQREFTIEKNYWKKFYRRFTDYLYTDLNCFDNYVGSTIKQLRTFFNYLNKDLALGVGGFHKFFYVRSEKIAIFPLFPEELNFLIYDKAFETSLKPRMKEVKDFFVFGCTVALRFSDLAALKKSNVRLVNGKYYLAVRSIKTGIDSLIKLPVYAVEIVNRYNKLNKRLLPSFNIATLNHYIKLLFEQAGFVHSINVSRGKRGVAIPRGKNQQGLRFCDVASTHTMRRTAITTMLSLGVPEQVVRKISGHSASGKEFYRYVFWAQTYQDQETEKMFEQLKEKKLEVAYKSENSTLQVSEKWG